MVQEDDGFIARSLELRFQPSERIVAGRCGVRRLCAERLRIDEQEDQAFDFDGVTCRAKQLLPAFGHRCLSRAWDNVMVAGHDVERGVEFAEDRLRLRDDGGVFDRVVKHIARNRHEGNGHGQRVDRLDDSSQSLRCLVRLVGTEMRVADLHKMDRPVSLPV